MTKLFLILMLTVSLVSNCEEKKNKETSKEHSDTELMDQSMLHDSIYEKYESPPVIPSNKKTPPKKNDSI